MPNRKPEKADVLQGTLDLMVLQTAATLGPLHGYAIAARLEQVSAGALRLNMGTLYPGLMRLEQRGLLRAKWSVTDNNRKARYCAISAVCHGSRISRATCASAAACSPGIRGSQSSRLCRWRLASAPTPRSSVLPMPSCSGRSPCRAPARC